MTKLDLTFRRYNNPRWPADRAMHDADCWTFQIELNEFPIQEFDQFDYRMDVTGSYKETYREARQYVDGLADALKLVRPQLVTMVKREVKEVQWVEEDTLNQETK